jgi:hypothetical protein
VNSGIFGDLRLMPPNEFLIVSFYAGISFVLEAPVILILMSLIGDTMLFGRKALVL